MHPRILLISGNYFPELTGIGKYNKEMTEWMADNGFDVTVIATYPYYPYWKIQAPYRSKAKWYSNEYLKTAQGNQITVYRCPHYVPQKPTGIRRMLLDLSFVIAAFFRMLHLLGKKKFDCIITVTPSLILGMLAITYKKLRNAKFLFHIQDLQIEAARDLKLIRSQKVISALFYLEKFIMKRADVISSISTGMIARIKEKTKKEVLLFPNWVDLNVIHPIRDKAPLKREFGFDPADKIVLYSGSIGEKQGIEAILYVAEKQKNNSHIKFVICGSGPYKRNLENMAKEMGLANIVFFPLQPLEKLNHFLNSADVHLIIQKSNASDLVMPSKLTNILATGGIAIVTANDDCSLYHLIDKHKIGLLVKAEDADALNDVIVKALSGSMEHISRNGLSYARQYLDIDSVINNYLMQAFTQIISYRDANGSRGNKLHHKENAVDSLYPELWLNSLNKNRKISANDAMFDKGG